MSFPKPKTDSKLQEQIDKVYAQMNNVSAGSDEYKNLTNHLKELYALKKKRVNPDQVLSVVANLLGIGLVMNFERAHVVTTKAFGSIIKPKI